MPLVNPPEGSNLTAAQLALAEALVAAELGLPDLAEQAGVGESGEIGSSGLIALGRPAVSIQSLVVAGAPVIGVLSSPRTIDVSGAVRPYLTGGLLGTTYARLPYLVSYTAGWTSGTLPDALRQAVLLTAQAGAAAAGRVGIKSESMGPVSRTYADAASTGTLPADARALLRPWLPTRF